jgi:hypothetical protein
MPSIRGVLRHINAQEDIKFPNNSRTQRKSGGAAYRLSSMDGGVAFDDFQPPYFLWGRLWLYSCNYNLAPIMCCPFIYALFIKQT